MDEINAEGKPKHKGLNRNEKWKIKKFWETHYKYGGCDAPKLEQGKYLLCLSHSILIPHQTSLLPTTKWGPPDSR